MHTLNDKGKIAPVQPLENADYWFSKFTEILEEINARGSLTSVEVQKARASIAKYFQSNPPRGLQLLSGFLKPAEPYLAKFGRYDHLSKTFEDGIIRLTPASFYSGSHLNDAIRDDEMIKCFFLPTLIPYLMGQDDLETDFGTFRMKDRRLAIHIKYLQDYYMYCLSNKLDNRLIDDFDGDSVLIIKNISRFIENFKSCLKSQFPNLKMKSQNIIYMDPYREFDKSSNPQFMKHFRCHYQSEFRITAEHASNFSGDLSPIFLKMGPLRNYAEFLTIKS